MSSAVFLGPWWQWLVRGRSDDLLDLDVRRILWDYLRRYPGMHLSAIARSLGLQTNHAKYHLRYMEDHELVVSRREDGYWRFWAKRDHEHEEGPPEMDRRDKRLLGALRRPVPLHICLLLLDEPDQNLADLAEQVDMAISTLHYHIGKLEAAGAVETRREGRSRVARVADPVRVRRLLVEHRPPPALVAGFLDVWESMDL